MYPFYRNMRVIASAEICRSINEIARVVDIPVATVWRIIKNFERIGYVTIRKEGKNFQVFVNTDNPIVQKFIEIAQNYQIMAMNPEKMIGDYFEKNAIDYAFYGPTKVKYAGGPMTNQIWIAVKTQKDAKKVKEIMKANEFIPVSSIFEAIGQATQKIVVKTSVIDKISYEKMSGYRFADEITQKRAMFANNSN
ncbi:winged helix-turn-helix transcriptional regulator [Candidatus Micrarchaeota archaeon]|nr:winged helix-turn-helix transcriptional regulator [Candidatus Micrarchaeota archaeon]